MFASHFPPLSIHGYIEVKHKNSQGVENKNCEVISFGDLIDLLF
jgi:hypothetical protein